MTMTEARERPSKPVQQKTERFDVLIVGAGISGVGSAYHLKHQCPGTSYVVLESQDSFGGTWWTHRYPGIRSDSDLYTFGYRFKPWVGAPIATAAEILSYMGEVIEENDLAPHIRYHQKILSAQWSSKDNLWTIDAIRMDTGETLRYEANFLWMCQGYFRHSQGYTPEWDGVNSFKGRIVHPQNWPEDLDYKGKKVVVIGGGTVAQRRLPLLIATGACIHVVTRAATPAVEAMSGITLSLRDYRDGDLDGAWYAIAATDDPRVNAAVVEEAERRHLFCVRADVAIDGTAVTPASFTYAGLAVGVLAGGEHRRSAAIRSAIREALQTGVITAEGAGSDAVRGGVALVGGGPGDPELITVRGRRLLAQADVVVADRLAPPELLAELPPHVEVIDAAKIPYGRAMAQDAINDVMIDRARAGKFVVRLKGGDPFVFARGYEEVSACVDAGIPVTVVPGVTSAIGVPALAGVPVTHRAMNHDFSVVSGHLAPDHPESLVNWNALAKMTGTLVLLMAVERIELRLLGPAYKSPYLITDELMASSRFVKGLDGIPGASPEKAETMLNELATGWSRFSVDLIPNLVNLEKSQ